MTSLNEELVHAAEILGTTAGILTSAGVAWKFVVSPILKFLKELRNTLDMAQGHGVVLGKIAEQFNPNGGNSLRDVIDRIEAHSVSAAGRVAALIEYHDVAAFECDVKGHVRWVSKKWCDLYGMLPEDAFGNGWVVGVHEDDRDRLFSEWGKAVDQKREFTASFRVGNHELGYSRVRANAMLLRTPRGEVVGYSGTVDVLEKAIKP